MIKRTKISCPTIRRHPKCTANYNNLCPFCNCFLFLVCGIIVIMKKSVWIITSCVLIFGVHTLCGADSLIVPMQFPKTFADLDFVTRQEFKEEDYEAYSHLNAYEKWVLESLDEEMDERVIADSVQTSQNQPTQSTQNAGSSTNTQNTDNSNTITTQGGSYCQAKHPNIPENQKIPFGSPVLHEHFIYCAPYADLNRGAGCRRHPGYDIGCNRKDKQGNVIHESYGDPVFATADGTVVSVKPNCKGCTAGNYIKIDHGNGFITWYMHLSEMFVTKGQQVKAGCMIGRIGNTGASLETRNPNDHDPHFRKSISHVHYEMWYTGSSSSVTTPTTNKSVRITHGWSGHNSIDPTQFICAYGNFSTGYCGKTFPYQTCK